MDKYLLEILKLVNTIIIPGLGALTITNKETEEIMFMSYLKHDDGKLAKYIAEKEGWELNDAKNLISKYVRELITQLDKGEDYVMYQFGTFSKTQDDIEFSNWNKSTSSSIDEKKEITTPVKTAIEKPANKNVEKVNEPIKVAKVVKLEKSAKVKEVKEKEVLKSIPIAEKQPTILEKEAKEKTLKKLADLKKGSEAPEKKMKKGTGFWVGITLLVLLITSGTYFAINYDTLKENIPFLTENTTAENETNNDQEMVEDESKSQSYNEDNNTIESSENIQSTESDDNLTEFITEEVKAEDSKVAEPIVDTSELPYQIIAGSFSNESNAKRLVEKLNALGYLAIIKMKGASAVVSAKSFATQSEAYKALEVIKGDVPGGWVTKW